MPLGPDQLPWTGTGLLRVDGDGEVKIFDPSTGQPMAVFRAGGISAQSYESALSPFTTDAEAAANGGTTATWFNREFWVASPSGDAATDTANMAAAINAAIAAGAGTVKLRRTNPGTPYRPNTSLPTINLPTISVEGPGIGLCVIQPTAGLTGDLFRVLTNPFSTTKAGAIKGFMVNMTDATAGACALHYGDITGLDLDIAVFNAGGVGSKGVWQDNTTNWTERTTGRLYLQNNKINFLIDANGGTNSHARTDLTIFQNVNAAQLGVVMQNGVHVYESFLRVKGNSGGAGSVCIQLLDTALFSGMADIGMEGNSVGSPTGLSTAVGTSFIASGAMRLTLGGLTNSALGTFDFLGWLDAPGLATVPGFVASPQLLIGAALANYIQASGSAAGAALLIAAAGSDTNVGLQIKSKGTGALSLTGNLVSAGGGTPATSALGLHVASAVVVGNNMRGQITITADGTGITAPLRICTVTYSATLPHLVNVPRLQVTNSSCGAADGTHSLGVYAVAAAGFNQWDLWLISGPINASAVVTVDYTVLE